MSGYTYTIMIAGQPVDIGTPIAAMDVLVEVNRIPRASIVFGETFDPSTQNWKLADTNQMGVGKAIELLARDAAGTEISLFKGVIHRLSLEVRAGGATLSLEAFAGAQRLTQGRRSTSFADSTDIDAIRSIVEGAGLTLKSAEAPSGAPKHETLVQHDCTDWDFILSRADAIGLLVMAEQDTVSLTRMQIAAGGGAKLEFGRTTILEAALEFDGTGQHPAVEACAWDVSQLAPASPAAANDPGAAQGTEAPGQIGSALKLPDLRLTHPGILPSEELQVWADARLQRRRLAMVRGRLSLPGTGDYKPLDVLEILRAGASFSGRALITGIRHRITPALWRTDLQLGLPSTPAIELMRLQAPAAAGLLPAASGLYLGVVAAFEEDPQGEYRLRISLPLLGEGERGLLWARLATTSAGPKAGHVFRPSVGDEVVVGFLGDDPRQPIVLGALHSSKNAPDGDFEIPSEENLHKGILLSSGAALAFRDEDGKPAATLRTKRGVFTIDDDTKTLTLEDEDGNSLTLTSDGITIKSAKDLVLEASGKVTIKGQEVEIA